MLNPLLAFEVFDDVAFYYFIQTGRLFVDISLKILETCYLVGLAIIVLPWVSGLFNVTTA